MYFNVVSGFSQSLTKGGVLLDLGFSCYGACVGAVVEWNSDVNDSDFVPFDNCDVRALSWCWVPWHVLIDEHVSMSDGPYETLLDLVMATSNRDHVWQAVIQDVG